MRQGWIRKRNRKKIILRRNFSPKNFGRLLDDNLFRTIIASDRTANDTAVAFDATNGEFEAAAYNSKATEVEAEQAVSNVKASLDERR